MLLTDSVAHVVADQELVGETGETVVSVSIDENHPGKQFFRIGFRMIQVEGPSRDLVESVQQELLAIAPAEETAFGDVHRAA